MRSNYDTLTLKLQDNLDHFEKYAEKLNEASFFTQLVNSLGLPNLVLSVHTFPPVMIAVEISDSHGKGDNRSD